MKNTKNLILTLVVLLFTIASCDSKKRRVKSNLPDSTLYTQQDFTKLTLDSVKLAKFINEFISDDSLKNNVREFYFRRSMQYAWFNEKGLTTSANLFWDQLQNFKLDFDNASLENKTLDSLFVLAQIDAKKPNSDANEMLELMLTSTFFQYAEKTWAGTEKSTLDLEWFIPRKKKNFLIVLDSLVSKNQDSEFQEPVNDYYKRLKLKLRSYRQIQKNGGFPKIIPDKIGLKIGDSDSCLLELKKYLIISGDLTKNDSTTSFNSDLEIALKKFQNRMGLADDGSIGKNTLAALNKPISFRINQIMINLERLRWIPQQMEANYLLVNIPEYRLHVFEQNKELWGMNVVVGKTATKTSIFKGDMINVVLNPYWNIPYSIAINEILPKLKQNPGYLARNNMEALSSGNTVINPYSVNWSSYSGSLPYSFRQKPGNNNSLGKLKFLFPNSYSIYLHDTPSKSLFGQSNRAFSHGCIRIAEPLKLANYLLKNNDTWTPEKLDEILSGKTQTIIKLNPGIPVYIAYFTAWVDNKGQLNFRNDLYQLDEKIAEEIFGNPNMLK